MQIIIEGKNAILKKGTSFDYVSENPHFTDSEGYTFNISFPLKGCKENQKIFGLINRIDADVVQHQYSCQIVHGNWQKKGIIVINDIKAEEIKAQFLEGQSKDNYNKNLEEIYINELTLGGANVLDTEHVTITEAISGITFNGVKYFALPWINNTSGNMQNPMVITNGNLRWRVSSPQTITEKGIACQPRLIDVAKKICSAIQYTYDFTDWETDNSMVNLIICNALPYAWTYEGTVRNDWSALLPKWSVKEFFEQLGLLLKGEFTIDSSKEKIVFENVAKSYDGKIILLDKVFDEFEVELTSESDGDQSGFISEKNLKYAGRDDKQWKYLDCEWFTEKLKINTIWHNRQIGGKQIINSREKLYYFDHLSDLINECKYGDWSDLTSYGSVGDANQKVFAKILYAKDYDTYFVLEITYYDYVGAEGVIYNRKYMLRPINIFTPKIVDENNDEQEIKIVPVRIETPDDINMVPYIECGSLEENGASVWPNEYPAYRETDILTDQIIKNIENEKKGEVQEIYNKIYVARWSGYSNNGKLPCPNVDRLLIWPDWTIQYNSNYDLRLKGINERRKMFINGRALYKIKFLAKEIYDAQNVFIIRGQKYLCRKITATLNNEGVEEKMSGEFYKII